MNKRIDFKTNDQTGELYPNVKLDYHNWKSGKYYKVHVFDPYMNTQSIQFYFMPDEVIENPMKYRKQYMRLHPYYLPDHAVPKPSKFTKGGKEIKAWLDATSVTTPGGPRVLMIFAKTCLTLSILQHDWDNAQEVSLADVCRYYAENGYDPVWAEDPFKTSPDSYLLTFAKAWAANNQRILDNNPDAQRYSGNVFRIETEQTVGEANKMGRLYVGPIYVFAKSAIAAKKEAYRFIKSRYTRLFGGDLLKEGTDIPSLLFTTKEEILNGLHSKQVIKSVEHWSLVSVICHANTKIGHLPNDDECKWSYMSEEEMDKLSSEE